MNAKNIRLTTTAGGSDETACGFIATVTVDVNAYGIGAALHLDSDGNYVQADADAATEARCDALALEAGTGSKKVLLLGFFVDASYSWTPGTVLYLSDDPTTLGGLTATAPSGAGDIIQPVAKAYSATVILFQPALTLVEHT